MARRMPALGASCAAREIRSLSSTSMRKAPRTRVEMVHTILSNPLSALYSRRRRLASRRLAADSDRHYGKRRRKHIKGACPTSAPQLAVAYGDAALLGSTPTLGTCWGSMTITRSNGVVLGLSCLFVAMTWALSANTQQVIAPFTDCDRLSANPTDARRLPGWQGVQFKELRENLNVALTACSNAVASYPNELRFRYQFARALQIRDKKAAYAIFLQAHQEIEWVNPMGNAA